MGSSSKKERRATKLRDPAWTPLERCTAIKTLTGEVDYLAWETWGNSIFVVAIRREIEVEGWPSKMAHLSIHRNDRKPERNWRHFQMIKNEMVGPECEGLEIYPANSRLNDEANQYHLWVFEDPKVRLPMGSFERFVSGSAEAAEEGARQEDMPAAYRESVERTD